LLPLNTAEDQTFVPDNDRKMQCEYSRRAANGDRIPVLENEANRRTVGG